MNKRFEELKEKFDKTTNGVELCEFDDGIIFEVISKEVTREQLIIINDFLESVFLGHELYGIECIDNRLFLTYGYLE